MSDDVGAPWVTDLMGRKGVAKFLTQYLDSSDDVKVLNVNAPWGAGKTFFLDNWARELRESRAVIYFNAWQHDYAGDAFVALTSALHDSLADYVPGSTLNSGLKEFRGKAVGVIKAAAPAVAKGLLKKISGVEYDAVLDSVDSDSLAEAAEKALEELLQSNRETMRLIEDFKLKFASLASEASFYQAQRGDGEVKPLYIFIDELDRCRPTFSIELLEKVKHFFDVDGCRFIVACDLEQLRHSIGAVYGAGFEGGKYLKRFFDAEYTLSHSNIQAWVGAQAFNLKEYSEFPIYLTSIHGRERYDSVSVIQPSASAILAGEFNLNIPQVILLAIALSFNLKLRELIKCLRHVRAVQSNVGLPEFDFFFATYLVVLRDENPQLYRRVLNSNDGVAWREIEERYPPKSFYVGVANYSVHDVAKLYFNNMHKTFSEISQAIRVDNTIGLPSYVLWRFANDNYNVMKSYPGFVDLAHSIE